MLAIALVVFGVPIVFSMCLLIYTHITIKEDYEAQIWWQSMLRKAKNDPSSVEALIVDNVRRGSTNCPRD